MLQCSDFADDIDNSCPAPSSSSFGARFEDRKVEANSEQFNENSTQRGPALWMTCSICWVLALS